MTKKVSELAAATALTGAEQLSIVQGGASVRSTIADLVEFNTAMMPTGAIAESYPRGAPSANSAGMTGILTSGTLMLWAVYLRAGMTISAMTFRSGTQAAVAPTNQWGVLCNSSRVVKAVSPDATTAAWAGETNKTFTYGTPYLIPTSGFYYGGLMLAAGTVPAIYGVTDAASSSGLTGLAPILAGASTTGMTTPPAVDSAAQTALTAKIQKAYFYFS